MQGSSEGIQGSSEGIQGPSEGTQGPSERIQGPSEGIQERSENTQGPSEGIQGPSEGIQGPKWDPKFGPQNWAHNLGPRAQIAGPWAHGAHGTLWAQGCSRVNGAWLMFGFPEWAQVSLN